ncbi:MAG: methylated-DNA--[protein]-cysteine S-methyltransferase [Desulfobulbaceae bacterium]
MVFFFQGGYDVDMNTPSLSDMAADYARIEKAIRFIETQRHEQPDLEEIARAVQLSKHHFHRLFRRWAGVTPHRFLQFLTVEYSKKLLRQSHSILETSLRAGLSGSSRLHDLFITFEAVTPGEYRHNGKGLLIRYGFYHSPFGKTLLAVTTRGICCLRFLDDDSEDAMLRDFGSEWPEAKLVEDRKTTRPVMERIFSRTGFGEEMKGEKRPFHLALRGTNFQVQVWRALLTIPAGARISYRDLAVLAGRPDAVRAVAGAVARNPVAWLIPCHRVIAATGQVHNYRWGAARKKAMLGWEAGRVPGITGKPGG